MVRSVTKVWMTDTSACGRIEFHILWCRDCVSLSRSRFRELRFSTRVSPVWFRSKKKLWQKTKRQIITNATNAKGKVNAPCLAKGNL